LPDFSLYNIPKREKYTKWPLNVPNGHKIQHLDKIIQKIPASSIARPSKIYTNLDFWFENIPSGNTAADLKGLILPTFLTPFVNYSENVSICTAFLIRTWVTRLGDFSQIGS
jgi:hypothetical protein